jgi:outer membrane immunogenic protein
MIRNKSNEDFAAPSASWTGFYLGAGGGGGLADTNTTLNKKDWGDWNSEENYAGSGSGSGGFGTLQIGADYQFRSSPFVVGAFADFDFSGVSSDLALLSVKGGTRFPGTLDFDNVWTTGGRAGFLVTPKVLLYGLVAYTHTEATANSQYLEASKDMSFDGVAVGGGVDFRLSGNWFMKLEYRYAQYGSEVFSSYNHSYGPNEGYCGNVACGNSGHADVEASMQTARAVLSYKFGTGAVADGLK